MDKRDTDQFPTLREQLLDFEASELFQEKRTLYSVTLVVLLAYVACIQKSGISIIDCVTDPLKRVFSQREVVGGDQALDRCDTITERLSTLR